MFLVLSFLTTFLFLILLPSVFSLWYFAPVDSLSSYECGFDAIGLARFPFCMKFFVLALIFLVFDVEIRFVVPCLYSNFVILSFLLLLLLGLLYEFAYGGLD